MKIHKRFVVQVERNWAADGAPENWQWTDANYRPKTIHQAREIKSRVACWESRTRIIVRTTRVTERVLK